MVFTAGHWAHVEALREDLKPLGDESQLEVSPHRHRRHVVLSSESSSFLEALAPFGSRGQL